MPYALASIAAFPREDALDSGDSRRDARPLPGRVRLEGGRRRSRARSSTAGAGGIAVGPFIEGGAAGPRENARLVLEADARVAVHVGSSSLGQGIETVFAQIAADALERPLAAVSGVHHGSTADVSQGFGSYHSRSTAMAGSAILRAAESLRTKIRAEAAARLGCDPAENPHPRRATGWPARAGRRCRSPRSPMPGSRPRRVSTTTATPMRMARTRPKSRSIGKPAGRDPRLCRGRGCRRIVNPPPSPAKRSARRCRGSAARCSRTCPTPPASPLSTTLADYLLPGACETPRIVAIMREDHPSPVNPLGVKGAGEGGVIPAGGLIANAVADALGVSPAALPLSPPEIRRLIEAGAPSIRGFAATQDEGVFLVLIPSRRALRYAPCGGYSG